MDKQSQKIWYVRNWINSNNYFFSFADHNDEEQVMHSKSDKIEILISNKTKKAVKKLFNSLKIVWNNFSPMKDSEFVFDYVKLLN